MTGFSVITAIFLFSAASQILPKKCLYILPKHGRKIKKHGVITPTVAKRRRTGGIN
jgi:hypothetical protein